MNTQLDNFDLAAKFYEENKENLLNIALNKFKGKIDYQIDEEFRQCAVWFDGFVICYQDGDMNGNTGFLCHSNPGANDGLDDFAVILKNDADFSQLYADGEYHDYYFIKQLIDDFCTAYAEINKITL